jgi:TM2 domain-containing membrane protein YozV
MKNPTLAATLSIITGFGQIYNGQTGKGVALLICQFISLFLTAAFIGYVTTPLLWIYGIVDAYQTAHRLNAAA